MKTNSLFFISFAAIFFTQTSYIYGMLARQAQIASSHKFSRHMSQTKMCASQDFRIVPYNSEQHEKYVTPIVFQNMHRLVSGVTDENRFESTQKAMNAINSSNKEITDNIYNITAMKSYVCLAPNSDKPMGVINYCFREQSYKQFTDIFKIDVPQNAMIQMLAVDEKYQGKKIGSTLLQHALKDCEQHHIYKATLGTTSINLHKFYINHGFTCTWDGHAARSAGSEFTKWFQPQHPIKAAASAVFMSWFNNQHKK